MMRGHFCKSNCEVNVIRKSLILIMSLLCLLCLAPKGQAATLNSKAGAVTTASGSLNVRSQPSSASSVVATLKKGSYVTLMEKNGSWWRVEYAKGKYGYCHSDYITIVQGTPVTVRTNGGNLNVRSGAGTSYGKTGTLSHGEVVLFLKSQDGWSRVLHHGTQTGWVSGQYLSNYYGAIALGVPSFKQTDSRWGEKILGNSGKTFAQIGCATTAIAMMESYRQGRTIYPDAMAKELRYTDSGNVYWPSHYKTVSSDAEYLKAIYEKLRQGRPVLFGATNAYGAQHWVVITGYSGGSSLALAGFTIHDPGTWSRTNLQQFLGAYPNFYKYFFY